MIVYRRLAMKNMIGMTISHYCQSFLLVATLNIVPLNFTLPFLSIANCLWLLDNLLIADCLLTTPYPLLHSF